MGTFPLSALVFSGDYSWTDCLIDGFIKVSSALVLFAAGFWRMLR